MPADPIPNTTNQLPSPNYLLLTLVLSIFAIAPLFYPGYIQTHSGFTPIWNVADLRANLGNWGWVPHLGLNFDPLRSDGLLPYYLAAVLPLEPATAVKVMLGLSWLLGSAGMFLWLKDVWGRTAAVAAALVYTYLPFHIAAVYVRGAWGEALLWGLLPWGLVMGNWRLKIRELKNVFVPLLWLVLGLSQVGLTLWAFLFFILWLFVTQRRQAIWPAGMSLLGVLAAITIVFLVSSSPSSSPHDFVGHFLYPFQLHSAFWGAGASQPGWNDGLAFQLGLAAVGLAFLGVILFIENSLREKNRRSTEPTTAYLFWAGALAVLLLLQFPLSHWLWQLPLFPGYTLSDTQAYPWQLLGLAGLGLSVLAGAALRLDSALTRMPVFGAIIIFIILSSYSYLNPQFLHLEPGIESGPQAQLGDMQVVVLVHNFWVESSGQTAGLPIGSTAIPLAVYGLPRAYQTLRLNVTWQPLQPFAEDLKVFVHLVDAQNRVLAQFDGQPREGTYPTSRWIPGELIADSYPLTLPAEAPPGPYRVYLGLYNETTGARLPIPGDSEGRVIWDVE